MQLLDAPPPSHRGNPIPHATIHPAAPYLRPVPPTADPAPANDPSIRHHLASHPALGTLPEHDRLALLRWSRIRTLKRQQVICHQGDPATNVILVLKGYLKRSVSLADGGEVFLDIVGPGDCAGETAALDRCPHDAGIAALTPCRLLMIDARQFWQAFEHRPEALLAIMRLTREQQQRITAQLVGLGGLAAPARLANVLLRLARLPSSGPGDDSAPLRLSQAELAVMTGVSRELVNKQLREWRDTGWVSMSGGTVTAIQATAVAAVAGEDLGRDIVTPPPSRHEPASLAARRLTR